MPALSLDSMFRSVFRCALRSLLASALAAGAAQAGTWQFTYRGFYEPATSSFLPGYTIAGEFSGNDADRDGIIEVGELTEFVEKGVDFLHCLPGGDVACSVDAFSFDTATRALHYSGGYYYSDEFIQSSTTTVTGDRHIERYHSPGRDFYQLVTWTDETTLTITPVPEPSMAMMGSAGLLLLAWRRRRQ